MAALEGPNDSDSDHAAMSLFLRVIKSGSGIALISMISRGECIFFSGITLLDYLDSVVCAFHMYAFHLVTGAMSLPKVLSHTCSSYLSKSLQITRNSKI